MGRQKLTAIVPVRKGSQRIKNKNFKPFAIDVSSGVETEGEKDPIKIKDFLVKANLT